MNASLKYIEDAFLMLDKDGDGKVSASELSFVLKTLGYHCSEKHTSRVMELIDRNSNGVIDFEEFYQVLDKTRSSNDEKSEDEEELRAAFAIFDLDGDGMITAKELKTVLKSMGIQLSEAQIENMIKEADSNCDGCVTFEEFAHMMNED